MEHLKNDKPLIFFPAASVSHFHPLHLKVKDKKWDSTCLKIISKSNTPVFPVNIEGKASFIYHLLYFINKKISFLWLIPEFINKKNKIIKLTINHPVSNFPDSSEKTETLLKKAIYKLKEK